MIPNARVHGNIRVFGRNIYSINPYALRKKIGMVFQTPNSFPHMSIYDNIAIAARMNGVNARDEINRVVEWVLRKAMLWDEINQQDSCNTSTPTSSKNSRLRSTTIYG